MARVESLLRWARAARFASLLGLGVALLVATRSILAYAEAPLPPAAPVPTRLAATKPTTPRYGQLAKEVTLRSGQTLSDVLAGLGLSSTEAQAAASAARRWVNPRSLQPGDHYRAFVQSEARPAVIEASLGGRGDLLLQRGGDGWEATWRPVERTVRLKTLAGVLVGSLDSSIRSAGGNPTLAYRMSDVLQWDLDFNRDLQPGDRFSLLYEEVYVDGVPVGPGDILALTYHNGGKTLEAYRYGEAGGYYDSEGRPLKKMFLRSPLPYSRVTSQFSQSRFHPLLKRLMPHWGVDLGAPVGTPVRATANGVVISVGWDGGGGKTVKVRHPNGYITCYLHLSRYAGATRVGARVNQGDVIAYVGQTGLATGPHLDYRVQYHGAWINPMSLASVPAPPIGGAEMAAFRTWRESLQASLEDAVPVPAPPFARGTFPSRAQPVERVTAVARR